MHFYEALKEVISGKKIFRKDWPSNQFVVYQKGYPEGISVNEQTAKCYGMRPGDLFKCDPYLQIQTHDRRHYMWFPSSIEILADDWEIKD